MLIDTQIALEDVNPEYQAFVEKFKPKKTTDDCYTPGNVYKAVLRWVRAEYKIEESTPVVRPFWPGGDYEREIYPEGCVVIDNPPFSIISRIARHYQANGIRFFLFAPYLTNFIGNIKGVTSVVTDVSIIYENGAEIATSFLTNLEPGIRARTAPDLMEAIGAADKENRAKIRKQVPKYRYPDNVLTATMLGYIGKYGIAIKFREDEMEFIRTLDSQRAVGKSIFGGGYLLSDQAAAEKAAAEKAAAEKAATQRWTLSEHEWAVIEALTKRRETCES